MLSHLVGNSASLATMLEKPSFMANLSRQRWALELRHDRILQCSTEVFSLKTS